MKKFAVIFGAILALVSCFFLGRLSYEKEVGSALEVSFANEAVIDARLHTALAKQIIAGKNSEALRTLDGSIGVTEVMLNTCTSNPCKTVMQSDLSEAKKIIMEYKASRLNSGSPSNQSFKADGLQPRP